MKANLLICNAGNTLLLELSDTTLQGSLQPQPFYDTGTSKSFLDDNPKLTVNCILELKEFWG